MQINKLSKITWIEKSQLLPNKQIKEKTSPELIEILNIQDIEKNKDKTDLKPNVEFVEKHVTEYQHGINELLKKEDNENRMKIEFGWEGKITRQQIPESMIAKIIQSIPKSLRDISNLKKIFYYDTILVPDFDEKGNFAGNLKKQIAIEKFPEPEDHQTRLMIGATSPEENNPQNADIYMLPIPNTVSENQEAISYYQIHVLLHEFFHTLELTKRDPEKREKIIFTKDGEEFSFEDWWKAFEELILSQIEPNCVSSYAQTYIHELTQETKERDFEKFTHALAEQMAETFVAYILNIISNDENRTDFKAENFGNQNLKNTKSDEPKNMKRILMNKLYNAQLVTKEQN